MGFRFSFPIPIKVQDYVEPSPYLSLGAPCFFVQAKVQDNFSIADDTGKQTHADSYTEVIEFIRKNGWLDQAYSFKISCNSPQLLYNVEELFPLAVAMSAYHIKRKRFNRPMREEALNTLFSEGIIKDRAFGLSSCIGGIIFSSSALPYIQMRLPHGIHACIDTNAKTPEAPQKNTHRTLLLQKSCLLNDHGLLRKSLAIHKDAYFSEQPAYLGTMPLAAGELHLFENKAALDEFMKNQQGHELKEVEFSLNGFEKR